MKCLNRIIVAIFTTSLFLIGCVEDIEPTITEDGIIKAPSDAKAGDTYNIDGIAYTVVDSVMLYEMVSNDEDVSYVITSLITNMRGLFASEAPRRDYSGDKYELMTLVDLSKWDVSNVQDMSRMFAGDEIGPSEVYNSFNQNISDWDVSSVTNMENMFARAELFNQNINKWDVSSVTNMQGMFSLASSFNQPINSWDIGSVTNLVAMFYAASSFNQSLNSWDVSNVTNMGGMFILAGSFNQPLDNWDVSNVTDMAFMFDNVFGTLVFNQDLSSWPVDNVIECAAFSRNSTSWTLPKPNFTNCDPN